MSNGWEYIVVLLECSTGTSKCLRVEWWESIYELGAGNLVSVLETKNPEAFSELRGSLSKEVKAETFLV